VNEILLITPPDKIFNQNQSILLVYPSQNIKTGLQNLLAELQFSYNVYIYDCEYKEEHDIDWLLTVSKFSDVTILDIDNCQSTIRDLCSYLVSLPNTYWLTNSENSVYNKLSSNRIYDLDFLENKLGGNFEKE